MMRRRLKERYEVKWWCDDGCDDGVMTVVMMVMMVMMEMMVMLVMMVMM